MNSISSWSGINKKARRDFIPPAENSDSSEFQEFLGKLTK